MALYSLWICDGCDVEKRTTALDTEIEGFVSVPISVGGWRKEFLLCTACYERALEQANPERWSRPREAQS